MNYEQKYKEALERARVYHTGGSTLDAHITEVIFPELKESEDERIRKAIIRILKGETVYTSKEDADKYVAWLEKHGKQQGKSALEAWKDMRLEVYQQASGNRHEPNYSDDNTKMFSLNDIDEIIEKISEQSHNDKIEPKFKVGQWIVATWKCVYLITKIDEFTVTLVDVMGNEYEFSITLFNDATLWTINDAKDGGVLVSGEVIFIFNKIHVVWINCHCSLHKDGSFCEENYDLMHIKYAETIYPSTKEQRDTFFAKMKEAGYEWDDEKKELKMLERLLKRHSKTLLSGHKNQ